MKKKRQKDHSHPQALIAHVRKPLPHHRTRIKQNQVRPTKIIHVRIRPQSTHDLHSIPSSSRNLSTKSLITQKKSITQSATISYIHPHQSTPIYNSHNLSYKDDFEDTSHRRKKVLSAIRTHSLKIESNKYNDVKTQNKCPDWTTFENNHSQKKKKTKCIRACIIASIIIVTIVLAVAIIVPLVLLLNKSNTRTVDRTAILRWKTTGITVAGVTGQPGNASNKLNTPVGLAIDYLNALYIADYVNNRIQKYPVGASSGTTVAGQANTIGCTSSACLSNPADVAVDSNRNIYVLDTGHNRVQLWSDGSTDGVTVAGNNSSPNLTDHLHSPFGIYVETTSNTIYISDTINNQMMCYTLGTLSGTVYAGTGVPGFNDTQFYSPYGIYFDVFSNSLLIANAGRHNIVRWDKGASFWTLVIGNINGLPGSSSTDLNIPIDVTLDPMGNIYVADTYNHRIQFFPVGQSDGITIAGVNGTLGTNETLLDTPYSIAFDSQLNLYVSDSNNHRVQKFLRY